MPTYQYQCTSCSSVFEEFWVTFKEAEEEEQQFLEKGKCPECGETGKTKLMGAPMVSMKGGGWTNRIIGPSSKDSTGALKEHGEKIKEEMKNLSSKKLYGDINVGEVRDQ